jgi:hypothetical protein
MSPLFYEDSLGDKLVHKLDEVAERVHELDADIVEDPEELERAEQAVAAGDSTDAYEQTTDDWVPAFTLSKISGLMDNAGWSGSMLTMPLEANDIPFVWDPYPPDEMPAFRPGYGVVDRPFQILVPASRLREACELLGEKRGSASFVGLPVELPHSAPVISSRRGWAWTFFFVFVGIDLLIVLGMYLLRYFRHLQ